MVKLIARPRQVGSVSDRRPLRGDMKLAAAAAISAVLCCAVLCSVMSPIHLSGKEMMSVDERFSGRQPGAHGISLP